MNTLKQFFLFCSGANQTILNRTPTEVNKYAGIGATIFFTGVFAAIAACYALFTVFDSPWITIPVALMWGLMIFNLDRFIVSTMKKKGSFLRDFYTATPRIILALLIAIVIAKPLELKIFESEIESELVKMQQEQYKKQDDLVKDRYITELDSLKSGIAQLKGEITNKASQRDYLVEEAIKEADGTGGSMRRNLGPIYKTKRAAADLAQDELVDLTASHNTLINAKQDQINRLEAALSNDLSGLNRVSLSGFAARLEGLERASNRSQAIFIANIFIMLLFMAVETAPVITKLILERSPYDYVLDKHEQQFAVNHEVVTAQRAKEHLSQVAFDKATTDYKTRLAIDAEKELANAAIKRRLEELKDKATVNKGFLSESSLLGN